MHIHRTRPERDFTILPNTVVQNRRLTYTARGLLHDLLSRPDGWREDGRRMADTSPQGRTAVAKALRELAAAGYYRVVRIRQPDGTVISEAHLYDTPYTESVATSLEGDGVAPDAVKPGPGGRDALTKNGEKDPTHPPLPAQRKPADAGPGAGRGKGGRKRWRRRADRPAARPPATPADLAQAAVARQGGAPADVAPPDATLAEAAALLHQVTAPEPRLRLGAAEALSLAPLVTPWIEGGYGTRDLAQALLNGLPQPIHSAVGILRDRLTRKLPPPREPVVTEPKPRWHECTSCARPTPDEGICRICANLKKAPPDPAAGEFARSATRGRALVRATVEAERAARKTPAPP